MATLAVIVNGVSTTISGGTTTYRVFMDGAGLPPIRRLTYRAATQHGGFDQGYRVDMRQIRLALAYDASSASAAVTRRDAIYALFAPTGYPIQLRETRDDASVRQIDCHVIGVMDIPQSERTEGPAGQMQRFLVTLQAADPFWYDPTVANAETTSGTVGWQLAGGQIASAYVEEYVATPSQGQDWTATLGTQSNFSIALRTSKNSADAIANAFSSYSDINNYMYLGGDRFRYWGAAVSWDVISIWPNTSAHNIIIVATYAAGYQFQVYRDGTLLATSPSGMAAYTFSTATERWRCDANGVNTWTDAITRAAIYNVALSSTQVAALNTTLTSGDTTSYGVTIAYTGSADEYPILALAGPITSPVITNGLTGTTLNFNGYTIADGTTLFIDLRFGYKTVQDSAGVNRIDKLTNASALATWRLAAGSNGIALSGSGTGANTKLSFSYYKRYWAA